MTCGEVRERLDAWAAGELDPQERGQVADHLAECVECRAEAAAWMLLRDRTADLPRSIEPPRDLWPDIDRALDEPAALESVRPIRAPRLRVPALAAAAVALILATAAVTTFFLRTSDTAMARKLKGMEPVAAEPAALSSEELLRALDAQGLPPGTMAVVQRNLAVIDVAIAELEDALAEDPGNEELARMLVSTHRKRADLIEGATRAREES